MDFIYNLFAQLYERTNINFSIIYDAADRTAILGGIVVEFQLIIISLFFAVILGLLFSYLQHTGFKYAINVYVEFFRNTPLLIQLYFFYFAIGPWMPLVLDSYGSMSPLFGEFAWAVVAFSFNSAAYFTETFRSGLEAVPKAQIETAESLGMSDWLVFRFIKLPLAARIAMPSIFNNIIFLAKGTIIAYVIAVPNILYTTTQIWTQQANVAEMMLFLLLFYLILANLISLVGRIIEKKLSLKGST